MDISGRTQIVGVIGDPIAHTKSPAIHNAAFEALGMDWVYVPFHVRTEDLEAAIRGLQAIGVRGINATIPHKRALVAMMDELSQEAAFIDAVNTVLFRNDGALCGHNTDAYGFIAALDEVGIPRPTGSRVVLLGAGGAARAIAVALAQVGVAELVVANRTVEKAVRLAQDVAERLPVRARGIGLDDSALGAVLPDSALLVNATAAGMGGQDPLPLDKRLLSPPMAVYDIIYAPTETPLLKDAADRGCRTLNGLGMLVHQGAAAFKLWTGVEPPVTAMREALAASLSV